MKLQRRVNRRIGDKEYLKWYVDDIPPDVIKKVGWKEKSNLEVIVKDGKLIIKNKK